MSKLSRSQMLASIDDDCGGHSEPVHHRGAQADGSRKNVEDGRCETQTDDLSEQQVKELLEEASVDIGAFLQKNGVAYTVKNKDDCVVYELDQCPNNPDHRQSAFLQYSKGNVEFKCFHDSCCEFDFARAVFKLAKVKGEGIQNMGLDSKLHALNRFHAVVNLNGKFAILKLGIDPITNHATQKFSSVGDFYNFQKNNMALVRAGKGYKSVLVADQWMKWNNRREYQGVIFEPGRQIPGYYNLYQGFAVEPKAGDCSLYLDHIREVIASGDPVVAGYVIAWMADTVQNPGGPRCGTAIALGGIQGCGKGTLVYYFGKLFGPHYLHLSGAEQLTGRFNEHLNAKLLVFADEAVWAGDKSAEGKLKAMITEPDMFVEPKGLNGFSISNHMRLILASNNDWIVPAGLEERRFLVLTVSPHRAGDHEYFASIAEQMDNGGLEALLHYLLNYDLSSVNLRQIPRTRALFDQMVSSMTPFEKFWLDRLTGGRLFELVVNKILSSGAELLEEYIEPWPSEVLVSDLFTEFQLFCREMNVRYRSSAVQMGKALIQICPEVARKRSGTGARQYYYALPDLEICRKAFEERVKIAIEWN